MHKNFIWVTTDWCDICQYIVIFAFEEKDQVMQFSKIFGLEHYALNPKLTLYQPWFLKNELLILFFSFYYIVSHYVVHKLGFYFLSIASQKKVLIWFTLLSHVQNGSSSNCLVCCHD